MSLMSITKTRVMRKYIPKVNEHNQYRWTDRHTNIQPYKKKINMSVREK